MDNANPTILNASDLPSRKLRQSKQAVASSFGGSLLLSGVVPSAHMNDLFTCGSTALDPLLDEDDSDGNDSTVDQIDEQEIYGWFFFFFLVLSPVGYALPCFVKRKEKELC